MKSSQKFDWKATGITDPESRTNISIVMDMLERTAEIPGDVAECGVFQGHSLAAIALKLKRLGSAKALWAFDSFEGLPEGEPIDMIDGRFHAKAKAGYFGNTSVETVKAKLAIVDYRGGSAHLQKGWFEETLPRFNGRLSLLFLDCDLYASYRTCLRELWPKVSPEGVVVFDEYYSLKYPGAKKAVDEFFADKDEKPALAEEYLKDSTFERWYVRKRR